jgi:hypothetical protein
MPTFTLTLGEHAHLADLGGKITKEDLYGGVKRIVEVDGVELERGYLLPNGVLVRKSQLSMATLDPEGTPDEEPLAFIDDQPVAPIPSSFNEPATIEPVPMVRLAQFATADVYAIQVDLAAGLYATRFNYRQGYQSRAALILVREDAAFLLVGEPKEPPFVGRTVPYEFFDAMEATDADTDPLDFSMN